MPVLYLDVIICPECGWLQDASISYQEGHPWPIYVKECERCEYIILESEWQSITAVLALQTPPAPVTYPTTEDQPLETERTLRWKKPKPSRQPAHLTPAA